MKKKKNDLNRHRQEYLFFCPCVRYSMTCGLCVCVCVRACVRVCVFIGFFLIFNIKINYAAILYVQMLQVYIQYIKNP